jgi:CxxC-x17-CxxC domain-containing protein
MFQDKTLVCKECEREFVFSAAEQEFYAEKGFQNDPARCPQCRAARKASMKKNGRSGGRPERQMYTTVCAACGATTEVPFKPSGARPVYCKDCYNKR